MGRWGKCDFKQLKTLSKRMEKLASTDYDQFCKTAAKELAARLLAKVIRRTPVGKKPTLKQLGGDGAKKSVKVKGDSGKTKSFLTREGAIQEQYWSGYMGGTLRRGWTAKTEAEAKGGGGDQNAIEYAKSLPITKTGNTYQIEIINPVHYASYVEFGHRQKPGRYVPAIGKQLKAGWVKGRFMLTISEQELQAQAQPLVEKMLLQVLGECFNGK